MKKSPESPWLYRWRDRLLSEAGPRSAMRRHVLNVLSKWGNSDGSRLFPSTRKLAKATGLSERSVQEHLREAEREGWISRTPVGPKGGHGWRHMHYEIRFPEQGAAGVSAPSPNEVRKELPDLPEGAEDHDITCGRSRHNVRKELPVTYPSTYPDTYPGKDDAPAGAPVLSDDELFHRLLRVWSYAREEGEVHPDNWLPGETPWRGLDLLERKDPEVARIVAEWYREAGLEVSIALHGPNREVTA